MSTSAPAPVPPRPTLPARTVVVPDRGEFFLRDSHPTLGPGEGDAPVVMLLHGWFASADLNWIGQYDALTDAGYRVLAIDHRGHGRGLRPLEPFRLVDCAADAAAVIRTLGVAPSLVVGYSMGGAIAQLLARDHPDVLSALILSGTSQHFQDPQEQRSFKAMGALSIGLSVAPRALLRRGFKRVGLGDGRQTAYLMAEITRHSARDIAEAGRELGRFDSRPWLDGLDLPCAVVLTSRDEAVPPHKQRELAAAARASVFEAPIMHLQISSHAEKYNPALLAALANVTAVPAVR